MNGPANRSRVGAVIVHYEAVDDLGHCLAALGQGTVTPDQIVIVDNSQNPSSRTEAEILSKEHSASYLAMDGNVGFGAGCNRGVELLEDWDQVLFINQDATVTADTLATLSACLDKDDNLGAVNPLIVTHENRVWFAGGHLSRRLARLSRPHFGEDESSVTEFDTDWLNGCALLVRRNAWNQLVGFNENYFLYWEDVDFSLRLRNAGWGMGVALGAKVVHQRGPYGDNLRNVSPVLIEQSIRSRLIFIKENLSRVEQLTAWPYTFVNALRLATLGVRARPSQIGAMLGAVTAGFQARKT